MGKQKFYAVAVGKKPGIYYSWEECSSNVQGVKGAAYKSFPTLREAAAYLADFEGLKEDAADADQNGRDVINDRIDGMIRDLGPEDVIAFVDGSYDTAGETSGYGVVLIFSDGNREELQGHFDRGYSEDFINLRNVAAELEGVKAAVTRAIDAGKKKIMIFYDYSGIEKWADDSWKANKDITKAYKTFIRESREKIVIEFFKVESHTGIALNDEADRLAKSAATANL